MHSMSFFTLNAVHTELDEQFLAHQEQVLSGRFAESLRTLDAFTAAIRLHMTQEEDVLLPIYVERGRPQFPAQRLQDRVFRLEHRKLLDLLGRIRARIEEVARGPARAAPRQIIALIERESVFKHVLEHHGERENQVLYPELNRVTDADERSGLVGRLLEEWVSAVRPERVMSCVSALEARSPAACRHLSLV